uniref:CAAX prenyl protease 2/Lysostaphin resistance protein A-like domain-containing protein n=1 Tax=Manihot esculenta TaxID=3983 RepID=A0A2C9WJA6_MANES
MQVMLLWVVSFWFIGSWVIPFVAHMAGFNKESLTFRGQALFSLVTDVIEGLAGIAILHRCLSRFCPLPSDWIKFSLKGSWVIPFAAHMAGFNKESLTFRGQALFNLVTDVTEGLAGIAILHRCLSRFCPLPSDWFRFSLKGNWLLDVALGCFMFPLVNRLSQFNLSLLPILPSTPSIAARDPVAMTLYAIVVSVCAPVWEEIVFRGFLLPSLTRYMPVWCAILVSSVAFALAYFDVQRMLPLIFLGVVMGVIFTRSRNLMSSMLLHSLWNGFVFLDLMR